MKHITFKLIESLLPKRTYLYYVDYRESLDNHLSEIQEEINNPFSGHLDDVINDWTTFESEDEYIKELKRDINIGYNFSEKTIERAIKKFDDEIREHLRYADNSNPIGELLSNTNSEACFYDFNVWIGDYTTNLKERIRELKKCLKIPIKDKRYDKQLTELTENASYGGNLVIYFNPDDWTDFAERDVEKENAIRFYGNVEIAIIHTGNGSGHNVTLPNFETGKLKLNNYKIKIDRIIKYSYVHEVCGMFSDFCSGTNYELTRMRKYIPDDETEIDAHMREERKYDKTFKSGKCTFGDMDIKRHRDTYYINDFPCGIKCPHCNTFFIN